MLCRGYLYFPTPYDMQGHTLAVITRLSKPQGAPNVLVRGRSRRFAFRDPPHERRLPPNSAEPRDVALWGARGTTCVFACGLRGTFPQRPVASSAGALGILPCEQPELAFEVSGVVEVLVDTGESDVGDLVELP